MTEIRRWWAQTAYKIARPVLENLAHERLRAVMPVEHTPGHRTERATVAHLEAFGRSLAGIAPWLELEGLKGEEFGLQSELRAWAQQGLKNATNSDSPDFLNFSEGTQPLVDAAFLAHSLLRAPRQLWANLDEQTQNRVVDCLKTTRKIKPAFSNRQLFSGIIEAFLLKIEAGGDAMRLDYAIRQHEQWYQGDGIYGDGPEFHFDYYNSFVIQPMLLDCVNAVSGWEKFRAPIQQRATRYAAVLERMIAPDGSFPPLGRSLCYRSGCFQHLAQAALQEFLPSEIAPAQIRCALTAAYRRILEAPGTFDENGWLQIGFCGHQPALGESYISTGSLYLCLSGFLPLGLAPTHEFWSAPDALWTSQKIYAGHDEAPDHAAHIGKLH
jgi:hypothetical protein